jgi:hypothetical protein
MVATVVWALFCNSISPQGVNPVLKYEAIGASSTGAGLLVWALLSIGSR